MEKRKKRKKLLYLGNKLSKHGKTPTALESLAPKLETLGFNVKTASSKKNKLFRLLDMWYQIITNKNQTDLLLIDTYSTANFWYAYTAAKLAVKFKIPYSCILHGGNLPKRLKNSPKESRFLFSNAESNIAPSPYLFQEFKKCGYENLEFIPNSVDSTEYQFKKRKNLQPKLLWVRSFSDLYNPQLAIKILEKLHKKYPSAELCMVGPEVNGNLEECKRLAEQKELNVKFTGRLEKKDWLALSKEYDIFINTTNFDNTPFSVIEAMALGLPVISTNVGGIPYLIEDGKDGILVEKNNERQFVEAIDLLLNDPQKVETLTLNTRKKVEGFDWQVVKDKWLSVLQ